MTDSTSTTSTTTDASVATASTPIDLNQAWKANYPSRYYAYANPDANINGYPTVGWIDISMFIDKPSWLPIASEMIPYTQEQWDSRLFVNQVIKDGVVVTETPIVPPVPLPTQADDALKVARTYVTNYYILLGEAPSSDMIAYQKALIAISNGTDTTSTELPAKPAEMTQNGY